MRILRNSNRDNDKDPRSQGRPTKRRPSQPAASSACGRHCNVPCFRGPLRQRQHNYLPAIATSRKVLHHKGALTFRERLLGEGGQKVGLGMRPGAWPSFLQPLQDGFGYVLHCFFSDF